MATDVSNRMGGGVKDGPPIRLDSLGFFLRWWQAQKRPARPSAAGYDRGEPGGPTGDQPVSRLLLLCESGHGLQVLARERERYFR
jgi:hypothetical protein